MNDDRAWDRITDAIDLKFGITKHGRETRPLQDAQNLTESISWVTFDRGGESYKLERVTGPAITDRRSVGSRRIGGETHMQNSYDETELVHKTLVFRLEGDEWIQVGLEDLGL